MCVCWLAACYLTTMFQLQLYWVICKGYQQCYRSMHYLTMKNIAPNFSNYELKRTCSDTLHFYPVCALFHDPDSISGCTGLNHRMIKRMKWTVCGRKQPLHISRYYPSIYLWGTEENHEESQDTQYHRWDSNRVPRKYRSSALPLYQRARPL